jgi:hypothetical protein
MSKFLILHGLLKTRSFLPEKTLPSREISALKKSMFEYTLDTAQCLNHISTVIIEVPEFTIMLLMSPPEWILFKHLILFEILSDPPPLVICECESVLLEESIDSGDTSVPRVFQVIQGKSTVLSCSFLSLECILCPHTLRIQEFRLP